MQVPVRHNMRRRMARLAFTQFSVHVSSMRISTGMYIIPAHGYVDAQSQGLDEFVASADGSFKGVLSSSHSLCGGGGRAKNRGLAMLAPQPLLWLASICAASALPHAYMHAHMHVHMHAHTCMSMPQALSELRPHSSLR